MRFLLLIVLVVTVFTEPALAGENIFNSTKAIKEETVRFGDEALEVLKTPVDTDHYGLVGTLAVAGAVGVTYIFDDDIRDKVQGNKNKTLNRVTDVGNFVGNPFLHIGIGVLADSPRWQDMGEMLGEAALLADASTLILKEGIGRARPFVSGDKSNFRPFQFKTDYDALPSGHASSSFAMASVMAATTENLPAKLLYYSAAAFVGFSRIYQDKHWTSSIVLSAAIGELCGRIVTSQHKRKNKLVFAPLVSDNSAGLALHGRW